MNEKVRKQILQFSQMNSNILYFATLLGNYDFQLEFEVENHNQLQILLKDFRLQFGECIRNFEILRVTQEYKYDFFPF